MIVLLFDGTYVDGFGLDGVTVDHLRRGHCRWLVLFAWKGLVVLLSGWYLVAERVSDQLQTSLEGDEELDDQGRHQRWLLLLLLLLMMRLMMGRERRGGSHT